MTVGNVSFNPDSFKDYTKEQFFNEFKGKLNVDKDIVWAELCRINKVADKNESTGSISTKSKKSNGR